MRLIIVAICVVQIPTALAATPNEQACILKAADTLPKVQGMKIGTGKAAPAAGAPAGFMRVEIPWESAGQRATWAYLCAVDTSGNARVQRLAN